jgi:uncharacterized protein
MRSLPSLAVLHVVMALGGSFIVPRTSEAGTPSFLCSKAASWVEKTVCSSDQLSQLDMELASVHARLLRDPDETRRQELIREQSQWWASRAKCQSNASSESCLEKIYQQRIAALRSRPDYPGDAPHYAPRIIQESAIGTAEVGWARRLSEYAKAIRACASQSPKPVLAVRFASMEARDDLVSVRLQGSDEENWICLVSRDGKRLQTLRALQEGEEVPQDSPSLYLTSDAKHCPKAVQVTGPDGLPFGWLASSPCSLTPTHDVSQTAQ